MCSLSIDAANSSQIIAEQIIPESEGGFWIREIGLYDADGVLIAVANCTETYKPQLDVKPHILGVPGLDSLEVATALASIAQQLRAFA